MVFFYTLPRKERVVMERALLKAWFDQKPHPLAVAAPAMKKYPRSMAMDAMTCIVRAGVLKKSVSYIGAKSEFVLNPKAFDFDLKCRKRYRTPLKKAKKRK